MPARLYRNAEPQQACGGRRCGNAGTDAVRQRAGAGVDGRAKLQPADVAHESRAGGRRYGVATEWPAGGVGAVVAECRTAFADCRFGAVFEHGGYLSEASFGAAASRAEKGFADTSFGVSRWISGFSESGKYPEIFVQDFPNVDFTTFII